MFLVQNFVNLAVISGSHNPGNLVLDGSQTSLMRLKFQKRKRKTDK